MRRIIAPSILLSGLVLLGCESNHDRDAGAIGAPPPGAGQPQLAGQRAFNQTQLDTLPAEVRLAFLRDYPDAVVNSVQMRNVPNGAAVYRIGFVRDGQPYVVTYDRSGTLVEPA